jgi:hypothetical protein
MDRLPQVKAARKGHLVEMTRICRDEASRGRTAFGIEAPTAGAVV